MTGDFWWIDFGQTHSYVYLKLGHSEPVDDFTSLDIRADTYHIRQVDEFRDRFQNINIYRSLAIWDAKSEGNCISGPFIVDIDNEKGNLVDALDVTRKAIKFLVERWELGPSDYRLFFTGHKGFNIEVRPKALGIHGDANDQLEQSKDARQSLIQYLRSNHSFSGINQVSDEDTLIDSFHRYIRLHDSFNSWIKDSQTMKQKKTEFTLKDIYGLSLEEIFSVASE